MGNSPARCCIGMAGRCLAIWMKMSLFASCLLGARIGWVDKCGPWVGDGWAERCLEVKWEKQRRFARKSLSAGRGRWPALLPHSRAEPWSLHPNLKGESQRFAGKGVFCRRAAMGTGQMASVLPHGLGKALRNGITGETRLELHEGVGLSYSSIAVSEGAPPRRDALLDRDKHPAG